ncbi:MAG TPA: ATP-binding protein [Streptosporangiaceae bacterium]|nr:ATP-binding protein [Streptosporangiaceae bacterium]
MAGGGVSGSGTSAGSREVKLDPEPLSARAARDFVRASLCELGFHSSVEDGALVVSELATNAILAAPHTPFVVVVRIGAGHPVIEVHDCSSELPKRSAADFNAEHGRGLHVVEELCADWDCVPSDGGKAVVAVLRR